MTIGIIGLGRLGGALARGLSRAGVPDVFAYSRTAATAQQVVADAPGVTLAASAADIFERCEVVFLWMTAAAARQVLAENAEVVARRQPFLVASTINADFGAFVPAWAETFPNVNLGTGQGGTLLTWVGASSEAQRDAVRAALTASGVLYEVGADEINFYCALTSNGPALYAHAMEVWADAVADRNGFDRQLCREMVWQTVAGTIALQRAEGIDASEVIHRVAHPGASTERGLAALDEHLPAVTEQVLRAMGRW
ncbi:MAG: NAD(P)-binding domain-containing protein [Propionibacteriales bacterium]|nr:NAD(P)-binding domain-containing protein [Propionibacteriales bacterium]